MRVLTGDIGATNTRLTLFEATADTSELVREAVYPSREFSGLLPIVQDFLTEGGTVDAAGFGVAGPVRDGVCRTTNLPWAIRQDELRTTCGTPHVALLNDWQIAILAIDDLPADKQRVLHEGDRDPNGPVAAIGLGTGLGEALLVPTALGPIALATEGGHSDFSPTDPLQEKLWEDLRAKHGRVSVERAVSGTALPDIYASVIRHGAAPEDPAVSARLTQEDPGAVIGELGVSGVDPACKATVELVIKMLGAEAGNLALKTLPTGGLYVGGGAALKLAPLFDQPAFMEAFLDKGRMRPTLQGIPVTLLLEPDLGLYGALAAAKHEARKSP